VRRNVTKNLNRKENDMNAFTIAGRLGSDPKLQSKDDTTWATLRVAVNGRHTNWFWVTAFGKLAETIAKKLHKGDGIAITGELRSNTHNETERIELIAKRATFFPKDRS
jgi:single-stranded DNA-binding protein